MPRSIRCGRCHGEGVIAAFSHVAGGRCLSCRGSGRVERYTAAERATAQERDQRHAVLSQAAAKADAALRPSQRHHVRDLDALALNDPAGYEAALAAVSL